MAKVKTAKHLQNIEATFKALDLCAGCGHQNRILHNILLKYNENDGSSYLLAIDGHIAMKVEVPAKEYPKVNEYLSSVGLVLPKEPQTCLINLEMKEVISLGSKIKEYPKVENVWSTNFENPEYIPVIGLKMYNRIDKIHKLMNVEDVVFIPDGWNGDFGGMVKKYNTNIGEFKLLVMPCRSELKSKINNPCEIPF